VLKRAFAFGSSGALTAGLLTGVLASPALAAPCGTGPYSGGDGSPDDPYQISTSADLDSLRTATGDWACAFVLTGNITTSSTWKTGIGTAVTNFTGSFNGGGYEVSGLTVFDENETDNMGFFGFTDSATINNIGFTGTVTGDGDVGGLIGRAEDTTVSNSWTNVTVNGGYDDGDDIGGLVGQAVSSTFSNVWARGSVTGHGSGSANFVGGLLGDAGVSTITDSWAEGDVVANGNLVGGLIGELDDGGGVSGSYASGSVTVTTASTQDHGGLIGKVVEEDEVTTVTTSYASGAVNGIEDVGGLIGENEGRVSRSYAIGPVTATEFVGGLVGLNDNNSAGTIEDSYATGTVTGDDRVGGLVGENEGVIRRSYSIGLVDGDANSGGLVGADDGGAVAVSYWDTETSGLEAGESDGGTGKTTEEMKDITTFQAGSWSIVSGWSSGAVWGICPAVNSGYPFLSVFYASNPCVNSNEARFQFTFWLPDGRECTSISPVIVTRGDLFTLPGADALCQTMDGSLVDGWVIPLPEGFVGVGTPEMPFYPGQKVRVSDSQQFTVVPFEPVLSLVLDSNVGVDQMCGPTDATFVDESHQLEYSWVPRVDVSMARLPVQAACQPSGYALTGWNTAADGSGTMFEPGAGLPSGWATDKTNRYRLFAIWSPA